MSNYIQKAHEVFSQVGQAGKIDKDLKNKINSPTKAIRNAAHNLIEEMRKELDIDLDHVSICSFEPAEGCIMKPAPPGVRRAVFMFDFISKNAQRDFEAGFREVANGS